MNENNAKDLCIFTINKFSKTCLDNIMKAHKEGIYITCEVALNIVTETAVLIKKEYGG